ncbi:hypothetical protein BKA82DRAFT_998592 [Pisolithus tinctorius]|uniref:Uncharacterized protein n=1 Tax=Pisolithus tinctorius Marx 270 TaxID=870435 RepID=A0A0C3KC32_PISTI|nr:hypothetical protein BKA82DRAFT_998592 [Pisolithus tinctorius]KIO07192.1 hypothetical protein M404DRAFT_998592 [Pisolithus tinctorius Marx 270]
MTESTQTTRTADLARPTAPAHADRTTTKSQQSLVLDRTPLSSPPNVISGQGPPPFQQYQQETNKVEESDNATHYAENSPGGTRLRSLSNIATHCRSTSPVNPQKSSSSTSPTDIAHWTNSLVHYTPVPPPRPKQPLIVYQPIDPEPPSLPPLVLEPSTLDGLLPQKSPVLQPLPDIPELPGLDFPWMLRVDTELHQFGDLYDSPSTVHVSFISHIFVTMTLQC